MVVPHFGEQTPKFSSIAQDTNVPLSLSYAHAIGTLNGKELRPSKDLSAYTDPRWRHL
jgi:hypothetical protein